MLVYIRMLTVWAIMGFLGIMLLPTPKKKWHTIAQTVLGGPLLWVMVVFILIDKWTGVPDDNERGDKR